MSTTLNCREVMLALRVSRRTVHEMLSRGELSGFRRGRIIRVTRKSVERLLEGPPQHGPSEEQGAA